MQPLVLLTLHPLLSIDISLPVCLLFAGWLLCCSCCCATASSCPLDAPALPHNMPPPLVHFSSRLPLILSCPILLPHLHLASFFIAQPPHVSILDFICIGRLLHCILSCCPRLPSSCQHHRLLMRRQLQLLFPSCFPQLVAALPLVASPPHIRQLALYSTSTSCHILFLSAPASCCVVSHQPATLQLPPFITSPADGWLLHLPLAPLSATRFCLLRHCHVSCSH
jgi:hypothetical protein